MGIWTQLDVIMVSMYDMDHDTLLFLVLYVHQNKLSVGTTAVIRM